MKLFSRLFKGRSLTCYIWLIGIGIVVVVWLCINRRNLRECLECYETRNREMARVKALNKRLENLREEKNLLISGKVENEIAIRNRFRMVRPGEHLVLVEREDNGNINLHSPSEKIEEENRENPGKE